MQIASSLKQLLLVVVIIGPFTPYPADAEEPVRVPPAAKGLLPTEKLPGKDLWVDPAIAGNNPRVSVWFDEQFLGDGKAYERRAKEFAHAKRRELRTAVVRTLKTLSERSHAVAKKDLDALVTQKKISDLERHWIVNGFSCNATREGIEALQKVKGVRAIFWTHGRGGVGAGKQDGEFFKPVERQKFAPARYKHPWYVRSLLADRVWKDLGIAGQGTLNVVHDFNFVFSNNLTGNLYRNPKEIPGNGKDDDGNGLIDDYHGYNFAQNTPNLTLTPVPLKAANPRAMHGFMCAAIICGAGARGAEYEFGLAPEGRWAGVIAGRRVEAAVEWAIEQGADTYSMSFSMPNLGEYRSHWRKLMEHGSFCGVCFASGAGNFAQSAKIPVQMRVPEDIPNAVFAATGVQRNLSRTPFSSQGPVEWKTQFYKEGIVDKPEVCAFNMGLPLLRRDGSVIPVAIGGNSFAGPMLAGTIALMFSADPDLLPWDLRAILTATATDVSKKGFDHETGHGLVNCYRAAREVLRRKAVREGKDARAYTGRIKDDVLDIPALEKELKDVVVRVARLQPKGQAAKLGLQPGDIIVSYNGEKITSQESMQRAVKGAEKREKIPVVIEREGKRLTREFAPGPLGVFPSIEYAAPVFR
jgi:Subtilase family/PDZ domain